MKYVLLAAFLMSSTSFAYTYVKCGDKVNKKTGEVTGYKLELSSENDRYSGSVGKNWNLKTEEDGDWLAPNPNVVARKSKNENGETLIDIIITRAKTPTGPTGTHYQLIDLYGDYPVLEKYTMGGFAGTKKIATYECISGND